MALLINANEEIVHLRLSIVHLNTRICARMDCAIADGFNPRESEKRPRSERLVEVSCFAVYAYMYVCMYVMILITS